LTRPEKHYPGLLSFDRSAWYFDLWPPYFFGGGSFEGFWGGGGGTNPLSSCLLGGLGGTNPPSNFLGAMVLSPF
jgi:hypothetical protein